LPCRSKQTMTGEMDDWTDGQMDDRTDEWNDASRRPLLYVKGIERDKWDT
jgi:hypothetical protein